MKSVRWNDKQLAALEDMIDIQALVADHFRNVILSLLYTSSQVVTPAGFEVIPTPVPSGSVTVPAFGAVDGGEIISAVTTPINVTGGTYPPTPGVYAAPPFGKKRIDIIVCRYITQPGDPTDRWYIDPASGLKTLYVAENSRDLDMYEFGIIRGSLLNAGDPEPAPPATVLPGAPIVPVGWFEICKIYVRSTGIINTADIRSVVVIGTANDWLDPDPAIGHRHFGIIKGDAPKIIHGTSGGIYPGDAGQSIDPATIRADDHHAKVHALSGPDHTGEISNAQHGARTDNSVASHLVVTPNPGGVAGFMSPTDKKTFDDLIANPNKIRNWGVTYHGRLINFATGIYSGGVAPAAGGGAPPESFNGQIGVFAAPPFVFVSPLYNNGFYSLGSGSLITDRLAYYATSITIASCNIVAFSSGEIVGNQYTGWVYWFAIGA